MRRTGESRIVQTNPPSGALPHRTIDSVAIYNASWFATKEIPLNPGLVGIIGARGSGKTALADLIALGARSDEVWKNEQSFIYRASQHIAGTEVQLRWKQGATQTAILGDGLDPLPARPLVQYLSQQFVEELCSSHTGVSDELLREIERVIYDAHLIEDRVGTTDFGDLLDQRASRGRAERRLHEEAILRAAARTSEERSKQAGLPELRRRRASIEGTVASNKQARSGLVVAGEADERVKSLAAVSAAIDRRQRLLDPLSRQRSALRTVMDTVRNYRAISFPSIFREISTAFASAGISEVESASFHLQFAGDVDQILVQKMEEADRRWTELVGADDGENSASVDGALIFPMHDAALDLVSLRVLEREAEGLRRRVGLDSDRADKLRALNERIAADEVALGRLSAEISDSEHAEARIRELNQQRRQSYAAIFDAIISEEDQLRGLYEPLQRSLAEERGILAQLTFSVRRVVDIQGWTQRGEDLLDLRKSGPFKGHGTLLAATTEYLLDAWRAGSSADVADAMSRFRERYDDGIMQHARVSRGDREAYWAWGGQIAEWLTSTEHISVNYGIRYDGVDIERLSPGTRGIVLLLLYLSLDRNDDRPLIIDQPEENLDPKSIFTELVDRFKHSRRRRQVIIVTHNANLIVNADADQVIIAAAGPHRPGGLPEISYRSGGLENVEVRREVCEILEGGERAFQERARRLRVKLSRPGDW